MLVVPLFVRPMESAARFSCVNSAVTDPSNLLSSRESGPHITEEIDVVPSLQVFAIPDDSTLAPLQRSARPTEPAGVAKWI